MRASGLAMFVLVVGGVAEADKKIQDMTPGYDRESTACATQAAGMQKIANGVAALSKDAVEAERPELEIAAAALAKGSAAFGEYCAELASFVTYLKEQADVPYRKVEREIDTRATRTSRLRREAKRQVEELAPLTRKMIPRIMRAPVIASVIEKTTTVTFPSGRSVELPMLGGTWKTSGSANGDVAEYGDKTATAVISTRQASGDCEQHRNAIPKGDVTGVAEKSAAWVVRYVQKEESGAHAVVLACVANGPTSVLATGDLTPPNAPFAESMVKLVLRMAAAFKKS